MTAPAIPGLAALAAECTDWTITPGLSNEAWVHCKHALFGDLVTFGETEREAVDKMSAAIKEHRARLGADATAHHDEEADAA